MSKFHSTVSRRTFMKGLGLAGAGLGAAVATTPVFHDLDEVAGSAPANPYKRWYVTENDFEVLQTPVDWDMLVPVDRDIHRSNYSDEKKVKIYADTKDLYQRGIDSGAISGLTHRDQALSWGARGCSPSTSWDMYNVGTDKYPGSCIGNNSTFVKHVTIPKYQGTPEDNLKMCRAALHYYGSPRVGAIKLNEHMKRVLFNVSDGTPLTVWEDIDKAYKDASGVYHIPRECDNILVWVVKQEAMQNMYAIGDIGKVTTDYAGATDAHKISNKALGGSSSSRAYAEGPAISYRVHRFLVGLGHKAYTTNAGVNVPFGIFAGLAEESRSGQSLSPDYGIFLRYMRYCLTDLPLAPTKPIDAGLVEFCKACKRCAVACPSGAVTMDDDISWETTGPWPYTGNSNRPGYKGWFLNWQKCQEWGNPWNCTQCQSSCPFNNLVDSSIHAVIRATVGTTTIFNSFFATMADTFNYSRMRESVDWWNRDLKAWKHDSLFGFGSAGW